MMALMSMPHVAYEYGILIRGWAVALVSGGDGFVVKESGESGGYMDGVRGGGGGWKEGGRST
jgi:hypothetical protein